MENRINQPKNPLTAFMRQPKIYIRLPSNGEYWPSGTLIKTETGEYPVYSMTAKDELMLKVPDALMSGQAVVDVIEHCMPNIKNAWQIPMIDMDMILIAIRLATYGEEMEVPITINDEEFKYGVDLRIVMDNLSQTLAWDPVVSINDDLTIYVKPMNYKSLTESALKTFETQKIIQLANDQTLSDEEKIKAFRESFKKLTDVTLGLVESSIYRIESSNGSTENPIHIREFMANTDKEVFNKVKDHLDKLKEQNTLKPMIAQVTDEMREAGVTTDTIELPLVFDPSTFFA